MTTTMMILLMMTTMMVMIMVVVYGGRQEAFADDKKLNGSENSAREAGKLFQYLTPRYNYSVPLKNKSTCVFDTKFDITTISPNKANVDDERLTKGDHKSHVVLR
ncbi:hypothetical protein DPMN_066751 [Dreissena polymorpha]|uniref:Uncharacterized protein n=1 Tax=Dreissena polymorpha TaxID=45954 RepID=A0A9D3YWX0_DREPO|nr:hypothetical protein DPMN_066751 [Dreissena polymorpha]